MNAAVISASVTGMVQPIAQVVKIAKKLKTTGAMAMTNDPTLIAAMCQAFAECETKEALQDWATKLRKEEMTDHDRNLLRGIYKAKLEWLHDQKRGVA